MPADAARRPYTQMASASDGERSAARPWLIGAWAVVRTVDGTTHRGVVHTVDPETGNVVLLVPDGGRQVKPLVLFAHAIAAASQGESDGGTPGYDGSSSSLAGPGLSRLGGATRFAVDAAGAEARRAALCEALREQRVPFTEDGDGGGGLLVLGCLHIASPYHAGTCRCENEIVLDRFLTLLDSLSLDGEGGSAVGRAPT